MNNDQYQDKYTEVFKDLKEEKMNWDFEDFLQKAEDSAGDEADIIQISKAKPSFPKWFWMAASVVLLVSVGLIFSYNQTEMLKIRHNWLKMKFKSKNLILLKKITNIRLRLPY